MRGRRGFVILRLSLVERAVRSVAVRGRRTRAADPLPRDEAELESADIVVAGVEIPSGLGLALVQVKPQRLTLWCVISGCGSRQRADSNVGGTGCDRIEPIFQEFAPT